MCSRRKAKPRLLPSQWRKGKLGVRKSGISEGQGRGRSEAWLPRGIQMLGQGSADSGQLPDAAREDVLEHSCAAHSCCGCLSVPQRNSRSAVTATAGTTVPAMFTIWPFTKVYAEL